MTPVLCPAAGSIARVCGAGRFVAHYRSRAIGFESVRGETGASGRLRLRADTEIAINRFSLRQTVIAEFAADLRPQWCTVEATVNARRLTLIVEVGRSRAVVAHRSGQENRSTQHDITRPPLLLIDNCFVSHALAALSVLRRPAAPPVHLSLPACEDLTVTRSPGVNVRLGGREYAPPALSLRLAPDLDEHVWFLDDWVERLVIPQTQMRVEWHSTDPPPGGSS